jgi:hypothetical protein
MKTTKKRITPYPLRLKPSLRKELETKAKESGRSLNTEIVMLLENALQDNALTKKQFLKEIDLKTPENLEIIREVVRDTIKKEKEQKEL